MSLRSNAAAYVERAVERHAKRMAQVALLAIMLFLWVPLLIVTIMSFSDSGVLAFPPDRFTLDWYHTFFGDSTARDATITSVKVSLVSVPIAVILSTLAAYGLTNYKFRGKDGFNLLLILPIIVPLVVTAAALFTFLNTVGIGSGFTSVVIAHIVRAVPFAAIVIIPSFLSLDKSLEEASMDLGASRVQTFIRVTLPNVLPGIIAGTLLAFAISFNEFVYTLFVRDTATQTLPIYIWNEIQFGASPEVNVISVLFIVISLIAVIFAVVFTRVERLITT
ncbi:ABC transporter permease [Halosolutus amylolyticus]|uniref:ABC transporter permease n=1 Tax=Halosolutus amylolyticus TaxID=2932267 RepID=A0ABD5PK02_9EURY|nr:ABC transporter permease [Halosolutus amylolyticus]